MMNKLILIIQNFRYMIKKRGGVFGAALISLSVCLCGLLFYAGIAFKIFYNEKSGGSVDIQISESNPEALISLLNELKHGYGDIEYIEAYDSGRDDLMGYYNMNFYDCLSSGKAYSLDEDGDVLLLDESKVRLERDGGFVVGKVVNLGDKSYRLIGTLVFSDQDCYMLPIDNFVKNYSTSRLKIGYTNALKRRDVNALKKYLKNSACVSDVKIVRKKSIFEVSYIVTLFAEIWLMFSVVILNIFAILYYWLVFFKRNYAVYRVCGASNNLNVRMIAIQSMLFVFIGMVIGNLIYMGLLSVISAYDVVYGYSYMPYIKFSGLVYVVLMVFSIIHAIRFGKKEEIYRVTER